MNQNEIELIKWMLRGVAPFLGVMIGVTWWFFLVRSFVKFVHDLRAGKSQNK